MSVLSEAQFQEIGKQIIDLLYVARNKGSGRVETDGGSKTETGVGRSVLRIIKEIQEGTPVVQSGEQNEI